MRESVCVCLCVCETVCVSVRECPSLRACVHSPVGGACAHLVQFALCSVLENEVHPVLVMKVPKQPQDVFVLQM